VEIDSKPGVRGVHAEALKYYFNSMLWMKEYFSHGGRPRTLGQESRRGLTREKLLEKVL
jgi:hypothetical protein